MARLLYELIGTGLWTMVFLSADSGVGRQALALWVITVFCWRISGSHFNPAISFAFMLRRDTNGLPRLVCLFYILFQIIGATLGALLMDWLDESLNTMEPINYSAVVPGTSVELLSKNNIFRASLQEFIGTMVYVVFFLTQTEEKTILSKEKGITCFVIASSYITARSMVFGQI